MDDAFTTAIFFTALCALATSLLLLLKVLGAKKQNKEFERVHWSTNPQRYNVHQKFESFTEGTPKYTKNEAKEIVQRKFADRDQNKIDSQSGNRMFGDILHRTNERQQHVEKPLYAETKPKEQKPIKSRAIVWNDDDDEDNEVKNESVHNNSQKGTNLYQLRKENGEHKVEESTINHISKPISREAGTFLTREQPRTVKAFDEQLEIEYDKKKSQDKIDLFGNKLDSIEFIQSKLIGKELNHKDQQVQKEIKSTESPQVPERKGSDAIKRSKVDSKPEVQQLSEHKVNAPQVISKPTDTSSKDIDFILQGKLPPMTTESVLFTKKAKKPSSRTQIPSLAKPLAKTKPAVTFLSNLSDEEEVENETETSTKASVQVSPSRRESSLPAAQPRKQLQTQNQNTLWRQNIFRQRVESENSEPFESSPIKPPQKTYRVGEISVSPKRMMQITPRDIDEFKHSAAKILGANPVVNVPEDKKARRALPRTNIE